jgi:hypothetical protein
MDIVTIIIALATLIITGIGVYYTYRSFTKKVSPTTNITSIGIGDAISGDKVNGDKITGDKSVYEKGK